jgi:hypothetical protein
MRLPLPIDDDDESLYELESPLREETQHVTNQTRRIENRRQHCQSKSSKVDGRQGPNDPSTKRRTTVLDVRNEFPYPVMRCVAAAELVSKTAVISSLAASRTATFGASPRNSSSSPRKSAREWAIGRPTERRQKSWCGRARVRANHKPV